tara:strand:- start:386 stop:568 length:183 start_codon:yes stop_codon:yes gene_type:complete
MEQWHVEKHFLEPFLDLEFWVPAWEVRPRVGQVSPDSAGGLILVEQVAREEEEISARGAR